MQGDLNSQLDRYGNISPRYDLNSARMRRQPSEDRGSTSGSTAVPPLGPGSSGGGTSGMTARAIGVMSPRASRESCAVAAARALRPPLPPAKKGLGLEASSSPRVVGSPPPEASPS